MILGGNIYRFIKKLNACGDGGGGDGGDTERGGMAPTFGGSNVGLGMATGEGSKGYGQTQSDLSRGILSSGQTPTTTTAMAQSDAQAIENSMQSMTADEAESELIALNENKQLHTNPVLSNLLMDVVRDESKSKAFSLAKDLNTMPSITMGKFSFSPMDSAISTLTGIPMSGKIAGTFGAGLTALGGNLIGSPDIGTGDSFGPGDDTKKISTDKEKLPEESITKMSLPSVKAPKIATPGILNKQVQIKNDLNKELRGKYGLS